MKKLWAFSFLFMVKVGLAAGGAGVPLDHWDRSKANDLAALQNGAKLFANYCIGCHAANSMRWNRLRDLGLTQEQIETHLLPPGQRVGDLMTIAMAPADAQRWLNKAPPDLSVITRARTSFDYAGVDYLYTFLRAYYRDSASATGWNNWVFPNIGMPHVLWQRQGPREVTITRVEHGAEDAKALVRTQTIYDAQGHAQIHQETLSGHAATGVRVSVKPVDAKQARQFDAEVGDLVAYLHYMTEPVRSQRQRWGIWVLLFIGVFAILAWRLNALYWKDIK